VHTTWNPIATKYILQLIEKNAAKTRDTTVCAFAWSFKLCRVEF